MILYFDNYMTDGALIPDLYPGLSQARKAKIYAMPSKVDVSLYTLASYAVINFKNALIRYTLENQNLNGYFERTTRNLFPKAKISDKRSDTQEKFKDSIKILETFNDNWIFYAGNNDHPFMAPETRIVEDCLKRAEEQESRYEFISIAYSHFPEIVNAARPGMPNHELLFPESRIIEEDENCIVSVFPRGLYDSMQIVNMNLLKKWFASEKMPGRIIRSESVIPYVNIKDQCVIIPKRPMCTHFDGYGHIEKFGFPLPYDRYPPLFIPPGFFESKIKIAFGYEDYRDGWVNINPLKEKYIYDDKNGTDMKIGLESIPLFWKSRIEKIDVNPDIDEHMLKQALQKEWELQFHPWKPLPYPPLLHRLHYKLKFWPSTVLEDFKKGGWGGVWSRARGFLARRGIK